MKLWVPAPGGGHLVFMLWTRRWWRVLWARRTRARVHRWFPFSRDLSWQRYGWNERRRLAERKAGP